MRNKKVLSFLMATMIGSVGVSGLAPVAAYAGEVDPQTTAVETVGGEIEETEDVWEDLTEIPIDESYFPDEAFRTYVLTLEKIGEDGILSKEEALSVTEIKVEGCESLTGIEYFSNLTDLCVADSKLRDLDISHNTELLTLEIENDQVLEVDTDKNLKLEFFDVYENAGEQDETVIDQEVIGDEIIVNELQETGDQSMQEDAESLLDGQEELDDTSDRTEITEDILTQETDKEEPLSVQAESKAVTLQTSTASQPLSKEEAQAAADAAKKAAEQAKKDEDAAKKAVESAKSKVSTTEAAVKEAYDAAEEALAEAKTNASLNVSSAKNDYEKAEARVKDVEAEYENAQSNLVQAEANLSTAQKLKDGTIDIKQTDQYKDEQNTKSALDKAKATQRTATTKVSTAKTTLTNAETDVATAGDVADQADKNLTNAEKALTDANTNLQNANSEKENAEKVYDKAKEVADQAGKAVEAAETAKNDATSKTAEAEKAKTTADADVQKAADALTETTANATETINNEINNAQNEVAEKTGVAKTAKEELDNASEKFKQGMLGFIDWMLAKSDLTDAAKRDLVKARAKLIEATQEDLSSLDKYKGYDLDIVGDVDRNGKTIVIGDTRDATSIRNIKNAIEILYEINEKRATDDNFTGDLQANPAYTNFYAMVFAQVQAMRSASCLYHTNYLGVSAECLAWGYSDPLDGWYEKEKKYFDDSKEELGIENVSNDDEAWKIAGNAKGQTGHYLGLLETKDQTMGVGCTQHSGNSKYGVTWSYDAFRISEKNDAAYKRYLEKGYIDEEEYYDSITPYLYTIADFEALFNEYFDTLNTDKLQEAYDKAASELETAKTKLAELTADKEQAIANLIKDAKDNLTKKQAAAKTAQTNLDNARTAENKAVDAFAKAVSNKKDADAAVDAAKTVLNKAVDKAQKAADAVGKATTARDNAKADVDRAESALRAATTARDEAKANLDTLSAAKADADKAVEKAQAAYDVAAKKLADLTSEETIGKLTAERDQAQKDVDTAKEKLEDAKKQFREAKYKKEDVRHQNLVISALTVEDMIKTPVTEEGYTYLNDYIDQIKKAETDASTAKKDLDNANKDLKNKQDANKNAQKAYTDAADELKIATARQDLIDVINEVKKVTDDSDIYTSDTYQKFATELTSAQTLTTKTGISVDQYAKEKEALTSAKNVLKKNIASSRIDISGLTEKPYTGKEIRQVPVAKADKTTLKEGTDYTVSYADNTKVGIAKVTITGKGDYAGTIIKDFRIQFKDVTDKGLFYYDPIYWAVDNNIVAGWEDGTFRPMNEANRAAVVTFLWRMKGKPEPKTKAKFRDMTGNAEFDKAISWASENGIVTGWDDGTFRPWKTCNRAAIVTFLWRYAGKPSVSSKAGFKDMTGNSDFDKAISWAASKGITTGWNDNTFRPWDTCKRLAIVSFLNRYKKN